VRGANIFQKARALSGFAEETEYPPTKTRKKSRHIPIPIHTPRHQARTQRTRRTTIKQGTLTTEQTPTRRTHQQQHNEHTQHNNKQQHTDKQNNTNNNHTSTTQQNNRPETKQPENQ
jgi:hypothetical protein